MSQSGLLLTATAGQLGPVVRVNDPLPPLAVKLALGLEIAYVQPFDCETVTAVPAIDKVAVRAESALLATETVIEPLPEPPEVLRLTQFAGLSEIQLHPAGAVTCRLAAADVTSNASEELERDAAHAGESAIFATKTPVGVVKEPDGFGKFVE